MAGKGGVSALFGGVGAWRVRSNSAVFYAVEIAAAKMLLFFRESVEVVILAVRVDKAVRYVSGQGYQCTRYPPAGSP